ncbi:MAG: flagellar biosynthetic protein FliO, partial [Myxococcales bacterium]
MRRLLRVSPLLLALLAPVPAVAENTPVADAVEAPAPALPEPSKPGPEPLKPLGGTSAARLDERLVDDAPPPLDDGGSLLGSLLRMVLVLGLVVGLIYLSLNVVGKRLLALQPTGNPLLKVHDRFALEPKKSLYVVEAAGEYLLLGVGEREISLVTRLETERV